jgi:CTP:molybdopterin cytidylyltransferase MocA
LLGKLRLAQRARIASVLPAVILAAGLSTRMGRLKALVPVSETESFLAHLVRSFSVAGADDVVVVAGYESARVTEEAARQQLPCRVLLNPRYEQGQLSSILAGLEAIDRPGTEGMLLTLVDVPLVSAATIRAVTARYRETHAPIVRPVRGKEHGHPVVIDRSLFEALRHADPARGAKPVVRAHVSAAGDVPVDDRGAFEDIDTPDDYLRVFGRPL